MYYYNAKGWLFKSHPFALIIVINYFADTIS